MLKKIDWNAKRESLQKVNTSAPRPRKAKGDTEDTIQAKVEYYLNLKRIPFIHIPRPVYAMVGYRTTPQVVKNCISKYLKGVPDIIAFKKEPFNKSIDCIDCSTLLMELKRDNGKVSQGQKNWHKNLVVHVPRSFEEARALIDNWMED